MDELRKSAVASYLASMHHRIGARLEVESI